MAGRAARSAALRGADALNPAVRAALLALTAIALAPGTWLRDPPPAPARTDAVAIEPLALPPNLMTGPFAVTGAWTIDSPHRWFGGWSALVPLGDGRFLAGSDSGALMRFSPGGGGRLDGFRAAGAASKNGADLESLTRDPASGLLWAGYEFAHAIERFGRDLSPGVRVQPPSMRDWSGNSGAETLIRLADGRFLVIAEGSPVDGADTAPGLLFPGDPVAGANPLLFALDPPAGYRPVDGAQLPDGRVLVLVRRVAWGLPPRFEVALTIGDPATIRPGEPWRPRFVTRLEAPLPVDNYEGLAVVPNGTGRIDLWLISDDNRSAFQRTLLLRLSADPDAL